MQNELFKITRLTALVLAFGLASGCAYITQEQFDAVSSTANNALSEARSAKSAADGAARAAADASAAAARAQSTADQALACCNDNSEKIERMFEKAMTK